MDQSPVAVLDTSPWLTHMAVWDSVPAQVSSSEVLPQLDEVPTRVRVNTPEMSRAGAPSLGFVQDGPNVPPRVSPELSRLE